MELYNEPVSPSSKIRVPSFHFMMRTVDKSGIINWIWNRFYTNYSQKTTSHYIRCDLLFYFGLCLWIALCLSDVYKSKQIEIYKDLGTMNNTILDNNIIDINNSHYFMTGIINTWKILFKICNSICIILTFILGCFVILTFIQEYINKQENPDDTQISDNLNNWIINKIDSKQALSTISKPQINQLEIFNLLAVKSEDHSPTISAIEVNCIIEEFENATDEIYHNNELIKPLCFYPNCTNFDIQEFTSDINIPSKTKNEQILENYNTSFDTESFIFTCHKKCCGYSVNKQHFCINNNIKKKFISSSPAFQEFLANLNIT